MPRPPRSRAIALAPIIKSPPRLSQGVLILVFAVLLMALTSSAYALGYRLAQIDLQIARSLV